MRFKKNTLILPHLNKIFLYTYTIFYIHKVLAWSFKRKPNTLNINKRFFQLLCVFHVKMTTPGQIILNINDHKHVFFIFTIFLKSLFNMYIIYVYIHKDPSLRPYKVTQATRLLAHKGVRQQYINRAHLLHKSFIQFCKIKDPRHISYQRTPCKHYYTSSRTTSLFSI